MKCVYLIIFLNVSCFSVQDKWLRDQVEDAMLKVKGAGIALRRRAAENSMRNNPEMKPENKKETDANSTFASLLKNMISSQGNKK